MSEFFDEFFGKKKAIQTASTNEKTLSKQIVNLKQESSASQANKTEIKNLTEMHKKLHLEIQKLKEDLIVSKSKSAEETLTEPSSSESAAPVKVSRSSKSSKKLKEVSSSTPDDSTASLDSSSEDPKS